MKKDGLAESSVFHLISLMMLFERLRTLRCSVPCRIPGVSTGIVLNERSISWIKKEELEGVRRRGEGDGKLQRHGEKEKKIIRKLRKLCPSELGEDVNKKIPFLTPHHPLPLRHVIGQHCRDLL